ncbi:MAG: benzoyl-CoA reductase, bzd-type, subunit N [Pseudomonadota bacterium]
MNTEPSDPMKIFGNWHDNRHEYALEWKKRTGGKVVGTFCTYVPEELIYAAGMLPVRILGTHEPEKETGQHILSMYCFFCRDCLAQGLKGRFDYLDGLVISQSCMHMRQAFHSWRTHRPLEFSYYINMPHHVQSPRAKPFLAGELAEFKTALEKWAGKTITDADLDRAIEVYNEHRKLMADIYELKKSDPPLLTGMETMEIVVSSQTTDKVDHNRALREALKFLPRRPADANQGARLMLIGSESDDRELIGMIESIGGAIVVDDHCTGSRYFWGQVQPNEDRVRAVADRYVDRPPCPSKDFPDSRRFDHILKLAKDYQVRGVFILQQKFCDPHESDNPLLIRFLNENGLPTLFLELAGSIPVGQFKLRVEAFLEILNEEDLF